MPDTRQIAEVTFAEGDPNKAAAVRGVLGRIPVVTAEDLHGLGCTGLTLHGITVEEAKFVRENMGGAGFGLTCYVNLNRYCLVHETIGGLQDGQVPRHVEAYPHMSRELTTKERFHVDLIESVRREKDRSKALDMLMGKVMPEAVKTVRENFAEFENETPSTWVETPPWQCSEHGKTLWSCRFCVASEIVKGALVPKFLMGHAEEGTTVLIEDIDQVEPADIDERIGKLDAAGASATGLYVQVARWVRKLARD